MKWKTTALLRAASIYGAFCGLVLLGFCVFCWLFFFLNLPKVVENGNITSLPDNE